MDTNTPAETEVEPTEMEGVIAYLAYQQRENYKNFYSVVWSEDWKSFELAEQILLRDTIEQFFLTASLIKEKFDATVWKGHSDGTVSPTIESIRKQREGDAPGRPATKPTADSVLEKRLKKNK
jgi:hypothetical protein